MKSYSELEGDWNATKGKLKQTFGILADDDLLFEAGKQDEMLGRIQAKLGKSKKEILEIISSI